MAIKTFTTGEVLTAADTNTYLANSGLTYITQFSLNTGLTTVDMTSIFTSTFASYRLVFDGITTVTRLIVNVQGLVGTTPTATGYYSSGMEINLAGAVSGRGQSNAAAGETGIIAGSVPAGGSLEIYSPQKATRTSWVSHGVDAFTTGSPYRAQSGFQDSNTQFNGLRLTSNGGTTFTGGTCFVYGYRQS